MAAGMAAGREHPSRILLVVTGPGRTTSLDAEGDDEDDRYTELRKSG